MKRAVFMPSLYRAILGVGIERHHSLQVRGGGFSLISPHPAEWV
jgi:hypothetical protein